MVCRDVGPVKESKSISGQRIFEVLSQYLASTYMGENSLSIGNAPSILMHNSFAVSSAFRLVKQNQIFCDTRLTSLFLLLPSSFFLIAFLFTNR